MAGYDPRPISEGGNMGMDETFTRKPDEGKNFRVVGVDTFDGGDWVQGDFETLEEKGIKKIFTPSDFQLMDIMERIMDVVEENEKAHAGTGP